MGIFKKIVAYGIGMRAVFLFFQKLGLACCIAVITFCCAFSLSLSVSEEREFARGFHFVVIRTDKIEAASGWNVLDGGAGFAVRSGAGVAVGVYLSLADAQTVESQAAAYYPAVSVESYLVERLRFFGKKEKQNLEKIVAAYATLYEYFRLLFSETERLLQGGTQESSRRILSQAGEQLVFLGRVNTDIDGEFSNTCKIAGKELETMSQGVILVKDLRYFLCKYAEEYLFLISRYTV